MPYASCGSIVQNRSEKNLQARGQVVNSRWLSYDLLMEFPAPMSQNTHPSGPSREGSGSTGPSRGDVVFAQVAGPGVLHIVRCGRPGDHRCLDREVVQPLFRARRNRGGWGRPMADAQLDCMAWYELCELCVVVSFKTNATSVFWLKECMLRKQHRSHIYSVRCR